MWRNFRTLLEEYQEGLLEESSEKKISLELVEKFSAEPLKVPVEHQKKFPMELMQELSVESLEVPAGNLEEIPAELLEKISMILHEEFLEKFRTLL